MYQYRDAEHADFNEIAKMPRNREELFYVFPSGTFPIAPEQLEQAAATRFSPTVITDRDEIVGYCNLYGVTAGQDGWLGNVIVHPGRRRSGIGEFLLRAMMQRASAEHGCRELKLVCHNTNTRALLFYYKQGFRPFDMKMMNDHEGKPIAGIMLSLSLVE